MANDSNLSSELSRELTLFHITMMGLGMMIGAGVFIGIGNCIAIAGPGGLLLTFVLNGLIALFTCMSFAELSSAIPRAGGAYNFARLAFGRGTSFLAGWMEWFASSVAGSLYAVVFATYTVEFFLHMGWLDGLPVPELVLIKALAFAVACIFLYVNYRGSSETGKVGAFFTLGQMGFVWTIGVLGVIAAVKDPERLQNLEPFMPEGWGKLLVTMGFIYVAFEGFEVIAQAGDEAIDPRRNIPKAMLYSVLIVTVTYLIVSFATVVSLSPSDPELVGGETPLAVWQWIGQFSHTGFGRAVGKLMPSRAVGALVCFLAVLFSSTSALNATIYSATRASYALGRDRMLPAWFARVSATRRTPYLALVATGVIVLTVATVLPTAQVASCASIMFLFLFFLVNLCVIRIRIHMGDELQYGFLMPLFPILPIAGMICQGVLVLFMHHMSIVATTLAPVWVAIGLAIYFFYSRSRAIATEDEIRVFEEEKAPEGDEYRVMVAVANPETALPMVRATYSICGAKQARVELLHMVPVPDQIPLSDAERYMSAGKEAIAETMLYLAPLFPISTTIRYCRNVARGIISGVRQKRTDLLIMGWHGGRSPHFTLGSTVDPIVERVPCNVAILKNVGDQKFKRVLVPVAGGANSALAVEMASILTDKNEGSVTVLTVDTGRQAPFDIVPFITECEPSLAVPTTRVFAKTVKADSVESAILAESANDEQGYDLVVIGATRQSRLYQFMHDSVPERIARLCTKPVVMVKASAGLRSWVQRWL